MRLSVLNTIAVFYDVTTGLYIRYVAFANYYSLMAECIVTYCIDTSIVLFSISTMVFKMQVQATFNGGHFVTRQQSGVIQYKLF